MSNAVDTRIVEMQFDNKQFEENVENSVKTLDKLKKSLDLEEAAEGLNAVGEAAEALDLDSIGDAAETVRHRFSALGVMGDQMLRRLSDGIVNLGLKLKNFLSKTISQFTTEPIMTGFQEYETQIGAIQTILSNTRDELTTKGLTDAERLDTVSDALDRLNRYADKTIYNFTEMTRNIGTFTAAGVGLEESVAAIQGIANLGAISGSNSEQVNRGMYQMSQALAGGRVTLMDWNSIVNAGMGGEVFQKALTRTADAMGVTVDATTTIVDKNGKKIRKSVKRTASECIEAAGSFRESLSSGWLTSEVLTATLEQFSWDFEQMAKDAGYTGDQLAAGIEEMKRIKYEWLLTQNYTSDEANAIIALADDATDAATKVKTLTQLFDTLKEAVQSGWTQSWEYVIGNFDEAKEFLTSVSDYFGDIINKSAESRNAILSSWKDMGGRNDLIESFWNIVYAIQNVVNTVKGAFHKIFPPATAEQLFSVTAKFKELTGRLKAFTENANAMNALTGIASALAGAMDLVKRATHWVTENIRNLLGLASPFGIMLGNIGTQVGAFFQSLVNGTGQFETVRKFLSNLATAWNTVWNVFVTINQRIGDILGKTWTKIVGAVTDFLGMIPTAIHNIGALGSAVIDSVRNSKILQDTWASIKTFFVSIFNSISTFSSQIWKAFTGLFEGSRTSEKSNILTELDSQTTELTKRLPGAVRVFSLLRNMCEKMGGAIRKTSSGIKAAIAKLNEVFSTVFTTRIGENDELSADMQTRFDRFVESFSQGFVDLKNGLVAGWNNIKNGLSTFFTKTIPDFFRAVGEKTTAIASAIAKVDWEKIISVVVGAFVAIKTAIAFGDMAKGIASIGTGISSLGGGIANIGNGLKEMAKSGAEVKGKVEKGESIGTTLLKIAASIAILVASMMALAMMDSGQILKAFGVIAVLALEMGLIAVMLKSTKVDGKCFLKMAAAVAILIIPIKLLGKMKIGEALKGIALVGLIMAELIGLSAIVGNRQIKGLLGMATAVALMIIPIKILASMDTAAAWKGIARVGAIMLEIGVVSKLAGGQQTKGLLAMSAAVLLMIIPIKLLAGMKLGDALKGIVGIGLIMAEMALFSRKMGGQSIKGLFSMALALNLMVLPVLLLGKMNVSTLVKGITSIGVMIVAFGAFTKSIDGVNISKTISMLLAVGGTLAMFVVAFKAIEGVDTTTMVTFAEAIAAILIPLTIAVGVMGKLDVKVALKGIAALAIAIAGMVGIVIGLGALNDAWGGMSGYMKSGAEVFRMLGDAIGGFMGSIGHGFMTGLNLPDIGTQLSDFVTNLDVFITGVKGIDDGVTAGVKNLTGALGAIAGSEFKTWLVSLFSGDNPVTSFSNDIIKLGTALTMYGLAVAPLSGISTEVLDRSTYVATALTAVGEKIPPTGALGQLFQGIGDMGDFSDDVVKLGTALATYGTSIAPLSGVSTKDIDKSIKVASALAEVGNKIPPTSNFAQLLSGTGDMGDFGSKLTSLGDGLAGFMTAVLKADFPSTTENEDKVENALDVAEAVTKIAGMLPKTDGWVQSVMGTKDLSRFATNVTELGTALGSFAQAIVGVDYDGTDDALNTIEVINQFIGGLEKSGGLLEKLDQFFSGSSENTLLQLTGTMATVGTNMNTFATSLESVSFDGKVDKAARIVTDMGEFIDGLAIKDNEKNRKKLEATASAMGHLGVKLRDCAIGVSLIPDDPTMLDNAIAFFTKFVEFSNGYIEGDSPENFINSYTFDSIGDALGDFGTSISKFMANISSFEAVDLANVASAMASLVSLAGLAEDVDAANINNVSAILEEYGKESFTGAGTVLGGAFAVSLVTALQNGDENVKTATQNLSIDATVAGRTTYSSWLSMGRYLGWGLANGIAGMADNIRQAAINAASGATRAITMVWSIRSPSRVGRELGMYFDLGIAGGIGDYARTVQTEATDMSKTTVQAARNLLRGPNLSIFDNLDPNPTIRPVLDLSDIRNGVSTIGGMFGSNPALTGGMFQGVKVTRNASLLNFDGAKILGSQSNRDVIQELRVLTDRFDRLSGAVSNMQVVLDTGVVVGETSAKMDAQLGVLAARKGRGN